MIKVLSLLPIKIASRATPEGLAGHGLSTTGLYFRIHFRRIATTEQCFR